MNVNWIIPKEGSQSFFLSVFLKIIFNYFMSWWFMKVKDKLSGNQPFRYQFFTSQVCLCCLAAMCNREVFLLLQVLDLWPLTPFGNKQAHTHAHAHRHFCMRAFFLFSFFFHSAIDRWLLSVCLFVCVSVSLWHILVSPNAQLLHPNIQSNVSSASKAKRVCERAFICEWKHFWLQLAWQLSRI